MAQAVDLLWKLEPNQLGLQFSTVSVEYENFSIELAFVMFIVDFLVYSLVGFYLQNVMPSEYGVRKGPLFFLKPSYWCPRGAGQGNQGYSAL